MMHFIFVQISPIGPILENKGMGGTFSEKGQGNVENLGKKCTKLGNILKKGDNRTQ